MRDVVVVLGVHRSGSSLCTNVLQEFGAYLGEDLLPPNEFNERGYFESLETLLINDAILAALKRPWESLFGREPLDPLWWQMPGIRAYRDRAVALLSGRVSRTQKLLAFKDPRFCVLLPIWNEAFAACGLVPRFVLTVRHPGAVARSLATRNGFSTVYSELLWLEHYYFACNGIREGHYRIVHYEDWFVNPVPQAQMLLGFAGLEFSCRPDEFASQLGRVIDPRLRHSDRRAGAIQLSAIEPIYECLRSGRLPAPELIRGVRCARELIESCSPR